MAQRFEVVFLGTGSPLDQSGARCGAGQVVVAGDVHVLVDCGWGAARRLRPSGVVPTDIDVAIFTHMHTDHMTDVPDFLFQRWTSGATKPLRVYGPEGTQEMIDGFLLALRRDIAYRLAHHGDKLNPDGTRVEVTEVPVAKSPEHFLTVEGLRFESFEVDHFPVVPAFGYRATFDDRRVVLSGDTSFCDGLLRASEGADMLVCEALNVPMLDQVIAMLESAGRTREAGMLRDVPSYHIATPDIARLAKDAGVGELVLSHIIPPLPNDAEREAAFAAGMSEVYPGPLRVARDMQRIPVTKRAG
ncbi:MAG: MBL fold metallo-hydrolase [Hyphomicrobiales bacterium]